MPRTTALLVGLLVAVTAANAQVSLSVGKSGNDIVLTWAGGAGPYDVLRSTSPRFGTSTSALASGTATTSHTDSGALADSVGFYLYVISDVPARPSVDITMPCPSPCAFTTTQQTVNVSGTTNATTVYVGDVQASLGAGTFLPTAALLSLGGNTVTASATNATGDWAFDQITVTRENGNQAPTISIQVSDRGDTAVAADGATIYDTTPFVIVNYDDPDAAGSLTPTTDLRVHINGTDATASFSKTPTQATHQVSQAWSAGSNFIYATVQDGNISGYSSSASAHVILSSPVITSFFPPIAQRGASVAISGAGFDPTPGNNMVAFNGVPATVTAATRTTLDVTVPDLAETGDLVVTVDGRSSASKVFHVWLSVNIGAPVSLAINPSRGNHVFFSWGAITAAPALREILDNGTVVSWGSANNRVAGLPVDGSGNLYFGQAEATGGGVQGGGVVRFLSSTNTFEGYANTRLPCDPPQPNCYSEPSALTNCVALTGSSSNAFVYVADSVNGTIKRIDPGATSEDRTVSAITPGGQTFRVPSCGMVANATQGLLYFTYGTNGQSVRSIPIPAGGIPTLVHDVSGPCGSGTGGSRGLALADDDHLIVGRYGCISAFDPSSTTSPLWNLNVFNGYTVSPPPNVAYGSDGSDPFVVINDGSQVYRIPKPRVIITDNADSSLPSKWVVDFPTATSDCLAANVITVKVKFDPATLVPDSTPRQRVSWTVEDMDDPSSDSQIDPNGGAGNDNTKALGTYSQWEEAPGFPMTGGQTAPTVVTDVVGNVSKVRFHPSCQPGDNYRLRATITIPVYGDIEGASDVLTVWRRLHIERDSMGLAVGPFQDDDVAVGDIPDPVLDFMAAAFLPAYIDVVIPPDTGSDTPNVAFQYNVPSDTTAVNAQANRARGQTSTAGRWVVYVQGGYDTDESRDNDPDSETARFGVTDGFDRNSLTFYETMRDGEAAQPAFIDLQYLLSSVALHEIGHQFGLGDDTGCIMEPLPVLNPVFCAGQILEVRAKEIPSAP